MVRQQVGCPKNFISFLAQGVKKVVKPAWRLLSLIMKTIRNLCRQLLDHVIILREEHLKQLLRAYIKEYYHIARPPSSPAFESPATTPGARLAICAKFLVTRGSPLIAVSLTTRPRAELSV